MTPKKYLSLLPKRIKVGAFYFKLIVLDDWCYIGKNKHWGMMNPRTQEITVASVNEMSSCTFAAGTLWHELFHALWYVSALTKRAKEEEIVSSLEQAYMALIIDNPWLLPWTIKGTK